MSKILDLPQVPAQAFVIARNCDFTDGFLFEYSDGTPIPLDGIDFYAVAGTPSTDNPEILDILLSASTVNGLMATQNAAGILRFAMLSARTVTLRDGNGVPMDMIAAGNDDTGVRRVVGLMKDAQSSVTVIDGLARAPAA